MMNGKKPALFFENDRWKQAGLPRCVVA